LITKNDLSKLIKKDVDEWFDIISELLPIYKIDTPERIAGFLSQCLHESAGFSVLEENLNYSEAGLNRTFAKYFKKAGRDAKPYARRPEKIANLVYANRIGNGSVSSGDGWRYRGRGVIQLTGKSNYRDFAKFLNISVERAIGYLGTKKGAMESACWFWYKNNINDLADKRDVTKMTRKVNGGRHGLAERKRWYNIIIGLFEGDSSEKEAVNSINLPTLGVGDRGDSVAKMQKALGLRADGIFGLNTKRAVKKYQRSNGLIADGVAGPKTLSKLYGAQ